MNAPKFELEKDADGNVIKATLKASPSAKEDEPTLNTPTE